MIEIKGMKVSNYTSNRKKFIDNQGEWAEDMVAAWGCNKYFESIWCHVEGIDNLVPNTMYIFCQDIGMKIWHDQLEEIDCTTQLGTLATDEMEANLDNYPIIFKGHKENAGKVKQFFMIHSSGMKVVVAQYFEDVNVLWTCDMSHTKQFPKFEALWNVLKDTCLRKFEVPDVTPKVVITLGADPEFEVINDGCVIMCPTTVVKGNFNDMRLVEKVGTDGARTQIELRPDPALTPEELVGNIRTLFEDINHYHISAKGQGYPIGGHIHFGLVKQNGLPNKLPVNQDFLRLLDIYLGNLLVSLSGQARGQYTQLGTNGGYRDQPHGFEYRPLPACVFAEPELCRIILKIAHALATSFYNNNVTIVSGKTAGEEDYLQIITADEYEYLMDFINNYDAEDYVENVVEAWVPKYDNPLTIQFFDLWNADIKAKFITEIKHIKVPRPLNVILYGISMKKHGLKYAGFPSNKYLREGGNNMNHPAGCPHPKNGMAFGLPQGERAYADRNGHGPIGLDFCIEAVKAEINKINWDAFRDGRPITSVNLGVL